VQTRQLAEQRVEADRILQAAQAAMAATPALLPDEDRARFDAVVNVLSAAKAGTDHGAIRRAVEGLDAASKDFAARRMNRALGQGLRGRPVGAVEEQVEKSEGAGDLASRLERAGHAGHSHR